MSLAKPMDLDAIKPSATFLIPTPLRLIHDSMMRCLLYVPTELI